MFWIVWYILKSDPMLFPEKIVMMDEFMGLFKTITFLPFSGVWGVIKMQYIFLNRNNFY